MAGKTNKLYGLFEYYYDYYKWETLLVTSYEPYKLKEFHEEDKKNHKPPLWSRAAHENRGHRCEKPCRVIREIELI